MSILAPINTTKTSQQPSQHLEIWTASVDALGLNPSEDEIVSLLAQCPDPSCSLFAELKTIIGY